MRTTRPSRRAVWILGLVLGVLASLALGACGATGNHTSPGQIRVTPPVSTGIPGPTSYAYLYSRVDYPLQIPVGTNDTVTLILSPQSNILTVTPAAGSGAATLGEPIPLPTDLGSYADIGATASTVETHPDSGESVSWSLTSAPRQSLLTPAIPDQQRTYHDVRFQWQIHAGAAGTNTVEITLSLYYVYLDGSEHDGTIEVSQAPIPIVAMTPTPLNTSLPPLRLPIAGLTGLAGILAVLRFFWGAYHTVKDVVEPVRDVATAAQAVHARISRDSQTQQPASAPVSRGIRTEGAPLPPMDGPHLWPPQPR